MRKLLFCIFTLLFLSGCATYKFQTGQPPSEKGYVVAKEGRVIPEYTVGKDNSLPLDMERAKARFSRRKATVEQYYEKMGLLKSRFEETFLEPPVMIAKFIGGFFSLPYLAYSNYKYEHDPKYREQVIKAEDEKFNSEINRLRALRQELNAYVQKDLSKEEPKALLAQVVAKEGEETVQEEWLAQEAELPGQKAEMPSEGRTAQQEKELKKAKIQEEKARIKEEKARFKQEKAQVKELKQKAVAGQPVAVIVARPLKGFSPLKVHFYGGNSSSERAKIIAYEWDFGDGDKSTKQNPVNAYYSTSFEPRIFNVTLTVTDSKGGTAATSIEIEVLNK